jgi:hypothetical protein
MNNKHACSGDSIYNMGRMLYRSGAVENECVPFEMLASYLEKYQTLPLCSNLEGSQHNLCCTKIQKEINVVNRNQRMCAPKPVPTAQRMWPAQNFYLVSLEQNDLSVLEKQLMLNIMRWGPLVMGFVIFDDFLDEKKYTGDTIYTPSPNAKPAREGHEGHAVRVVGWGEDIQDDVLIKYWICANSWGTGWGDKGYFKIERINPRLQMEVNHMAVRALIPKMGADTEYTVKKSLTSEIDRAEKEFINVDPIFFYPTALISKIRQGAMIGDLTPVIDEYIVPRSVYFWASDIGLRRFPTPSGIDVGPIYSNKLGVLFWSIICGVLVAVIIVIILGVYTRNKRILK